VENSSSALSFAEPEMKTQVQGKERKAARFERLQVRTTPVSPSIAYASYKGSNHNEGTTGASGAEPIYKGT